MIKNTVREKYSESRLLLIEGFFFFMTSFQAIDLDHFYRNKIKMAVTAVTQMRYKLRTASKILFLLD